MQNTLDSQPSVDAILDALPQTQCQRCDYPGCRPYADAIVRGEAPITRCPPGGVNTLDQLSAITGIPVTSEERQTMAKETVPPMKAVIEEDACIGCTKCLHVCPVDAIIGASKLMHTVIQTDCTGCGLCLPPCPVDCIRLVEVATPVDRSRARQLTEKREARLAKRAQEAPPALQATDDNNHAMNHAADQTDQMNKTDKTDQADKTDKADKMDKTDNKQHPPVAGTLAQAPNAVSARQSDIQAAVARRIKRGK